VGTRLAIPRYLGIDWWWLLLVLIVEGTVRHYLPIPPWIPSITVVWMVVQAAWLRSAEPRSKALYFYLAMAVIDLGLALAPSTVNWLGDGSSTVGGVIGASIGLLDAGLTIVGIFVFRSEMEDHFNLTDPLGLGLSGVMTFFFSVFYFQYHFHELYERQQYEASLATPEPI